MPTISRILVPVDFSQGSKQALDYAVDIANRFGASIEVFHVLEMPLYNSPEATIGFPAIRLPEGAAESYDTFLRTECEKEMSKLLESIDPKLRSSLRITHRIELGNAWEAIVAQAGAGSFDLIVVGTHGRRGFDRFLMGSVAEKVVRRAPCPVLTVRRKE